VQPLQLKLKNVPMDTSLVCSSTSSPLNNLETDSEKSIVLDCNNPEVSQQSDRTERKAIKSVFVVSKSDKPLMPCKPRKARHMLKKGEAHVINLNPFTIKLNFNCKESVQVCTLGIDTGFKFVGWSVVNKIEEISCGELTLDRKTSDRLTSKRMYRRLRRGRLRYRKPRFNNRKIDKGWLPPSIKRSLDTTLGLVNKLKKMLPVNKVVVETAKFDIQKINNPDISGTEYQQGDLFDFLNLRAYLVSREKGICQICGKKITDRIEKHHIIPRSGGGTNKSSNYALVHPECHKKLHNGKTKLKIKLNRQFKAETFMSIIHNEFKRVLGCEITFGYITAHIRKELRIEKSHANDAFVIAGGFDQKRSESLVRITQRRINNRVLQRNFKKGRPSIRTQRYKFQTGDFIWLKGKRYICGGTTGLGTQVYYLDDKEKKTISIKKIDRVYHTRSLIWEMQDIMTNSDIENSVLLSICRGNDN
jgi:5-methylcytosine-specific restriction endonuclease McrA